MKQLVKDFPVQLEEALNIGQNYAFKTAADKSFSQVLFIGLGGSGIGGTIVQNAVYDTLSVPFVVTKDYTLPAFVGPQTLVIAGSYSGNTEETLQSAEVARTAGATVLCITAGGKLAEWAQQYKIDCIMLPAGMPPRACLGYSLVQILVILAHFGLTRNDFQKDIQAAADLLKANSAHMEQKGKELAQALAGTVPVIYASGPFEGVAVRIRQQLNENGKILGWHGVVPEMNHNELVGWRTASPERAVLFLRTSSDSDRVRYRMELNKTVIAEYTPNIHELWAEGKSYWEQVFSLIHLTDFCSVYLAEATGIDATEVNVIDRLKADLKK